ncbi:MAG: sulfotransferase [Planctomycetaceae bacterium]|nr:sulfotransferase [Planctomycetaceae bacterium]
METATASPSVTHSDSASTVEKPRCILLAGSARGGTSWAHKVIDSHPSVHGCHEPFHQLAAKEQHRSLFTRIKAGQGDETDAASLMSLLASPGLLTQKPPFFPKDHLIAPAWMRSLAWAAARTFAPAESVYNLLSKGKLGSGQCVVVKNRPYPQLERILEVLDADVLMLLRHPCAVVNSWLRGIQMGVMDANSIDPAYTWKAYSEYITQLGYAESEIRDMPAAGLLAVQWLVDTMLINQYRQNPCMSTHTVVYEDLVKNPESEWKRVFEWLRLPFSASVVRFLNESSQPGFDIRKLLGSRYTYFSVQRANTSPVDSWKSKMDPANLKLVMDIVSPQFPIELYWPGEST